MTTDYDVARSYAAHYGRLRFWTYGGDVYQVQTFGEMLPDPDYDGVGDAFSCDSARVKRVMVRRVKMTDEQLTRIKARHQLYPDGTPVYDMDGYLLPSEGNRRGGYLSEDLRVFGPWRTVNLSLDGLLQVPDATSGELANLKSALRQRQSGA